MANAGYPRPRGFAQTCEHVGVVFHWHPWYAPEHIHVERVRAQARYPVTSIPPSGADPRRQAQSRSAAVVALEIAELAEVPDRNEGQEIESTAAIGRGRLRR